MASSAETRRKKRAQMSKDCHCDLKDEKQMKWAKEFIHSDEMHAKNSRVLGARVYWRYLRDSGNVGGARDENETEGNSIYRILELPDLPEKYIKNFWLMPVEFRQGYEEFRSRLEIYIENEITKIKIDSIIGQIVDMKEEEFKSPSYSSGNLSAQGSQVACH